MTAGAASASYWRDQIMFDELHEVELSLSSLATGNVGTPRWYPYNQALNSLYAVEQELHEQLRNAAKNPYYSKQRK